MTKKTPLGEVLECPICRRRGETCWAFKVTMLRKSNDPSPYESLKAIHPYKCRSVTCRCWSVQDDGFCSNCGLQTNVHPRDTKLPQGLFPESFTPQSNQSKSKKKEGAN